VSLLGRALDAARGNGRRELRGGSLDPVLENLIRSSMNTDAGVSVDSESAMRHSAVYGSRRIIAYTVAGLPADVLRKDGEFRRPYTPEPPWLSRPNREQLWPEFIAQSVDSLLGDGNLFWDIHNRRNGYPSALFVLNPRGVVVGRREDTRTLFYADSQGKEISARSIAHVRALTLPGHDRGLSPVEMARLEIGIGKSAQKYLAKFYVNGSAVSAVLEFPAGVTKEEAQEYTDAFREMYSAGGEGHKIAGLVAAQYKPMSITHEQAQFLEERQFGVVDIGTRIYGIPPHRLGAMLDKPQFGNSIEQQNMSFVQDAVMPWTTLLEAAFREFILPEPAYLKFSLNGLLRGDAASRAAFYQTMRQQLGVMNGDDVRALEDMNPMPDGKGAAYWMPANTYLVGNQGYPILPERQQAPPSQSNDEPSPAGSEGMEVNP
jgi:HK97 family phage portal protein